MKRISITILSMLTGLNVIAQKPVLNENAIMNWPLLDDAQSNCHISSDGKFVSYFVKTESGGRKLYLSATNGKYLRVFSLDKLVYTWSEDNSFTVDSQWFVAMVNGDSLCVSNLKNHKERFIQNVQSYQIATEGNGAALVYQTKDGGVVLSDLGSGFEKTYDKVPNSKYKLSKSGRILFLQINDTKQRSLLWVDVRSGVAKTIGGVKDYGSMVFDDHERAVAFTGQNDNGQTKENALWLYREGTIGAIKVADQYSSGLDGGYTISDGDLEFSPGGDKLFFRASLKTELAGPDSLKANVTIWNYADDYLPSEAQNMGNDNNYLAVIQLESLKILRLEDEHYRAFTYSGLQLNHGGDDNYLLLITRCNERNWPWQERDRADMFIMNTNSGAKTCIYRNAPRPMVPIRFSPAGRYLMWVDLLRAKMFTYDLKNGISRELRDDLQLAKDITLNPLSDCRWLRGDTALLTHDKYDIWKIDPTGKLAPLNLTSGYGRQHSIIFRIPDIDGDRHEDVIKEKFLLLSAFNEENKQNGFYRIDPFGEEKAPEKLIMSDNIYNAKYLNIESKGAPGPSELLIKAANAPIYLLSRSSSQERQLVITNDFRNFKPLTDFHPEKQFNWLATELVKYQTFDGRPGEGILYKPENFDPQKKYPLIIYAYERIAASINNCRVAEPADGNINIPWMVSRGYLVFCPDIHYRAGKLGEDDYNYVVSAVKKLKQNDWVDSLHIGYQGHSFGAIQGMALLTKTHVFAAALLACGSGDIIQQYLNWGGGLDNSFVEYGQYRMGASLWEDKKDYLDNDAVLHADQVSAPVLMMANPEDSRTLYWGTREYFISLRRLGKPCWMLEYAEEGHNLGKLEDKSDYTRRVDQFFDHYLKGAPAPKWMIGGGPYWKKPTNEGFELGPPGMVPVPLQILPSLGEREFKSAYH